MTYDVTVTREGKWWMIHVPALDGLTQARRLDEVEPMARSLVAITLDVAPGSFDLNISHCNAGALNISLRRAELDAERAELGASERRVREVQLSLARDLAAQQVPVRDIGTALGVSFQRAQQLTSA